MPFGIFMDHVRIFSSSPIQHLRRFVTEIGNSWKLLLTGVTERFVLNVTGNKVFHLAYRCSNSAKKH